MDLTVQVTGLDRLRAANEALMTEMDLELLGVLREVSLEARDAARAAAPRFTGTLASRISSGVTERSRVALASETAAKASFVRARAPHSWLVIHGRRPGKMPSVDPAHARSPESARRLRDWAIAKGLNPFLVARAIAKRGTVGKPFMDAPIAAAVASFEGRVRAVVERVLAKYRAA